jgi:hypothetical protein
LSECRQASIDLLYQIANEYSVDNVKQHGLVETSYSSVFPGSQTAPGEIEPGALTECGSDGMVMPRLNAHWSARNRN